MTEAPPEAGRKSPVRLRFDDGQVVVSPEDQDVFVISSQKAVEACQLMADFARKYASFKDDVLLPLHEWCLTRADRVASCYVGEPQGGSMPIFVIGKSEQYDFELLPELARMDIRFFQAKWTAICHQLPAGDLETLSTFFDPETALQVYAQLDAT